MSEQELLWFIFFDELIGALIIPTHKVYVYKSVIALREWDLLFFIYALFGSFFAHILNYILGVIFQKSFEIKVRKDRNIKIMLGLVMLMLPINFFGSVIAVFCGIARFNLAYFLIINFLVNLFF